MIIAALHITGTIIVLFLIFLIAGILFQVKWGYKRLDTILELAAFENGVRLEDMFNRDHNTQICGYLYTKYSPDKFANRISDMFRPILILIDYVSYIMQTAVILMTTWFTLTDDLETAKFAWLAVLVALIFIIIHRLIFWLCYLITGRTAGEAQSMRNLITEKIIIN